MDIAKKLLGVSILIVIIVSWVYFANFFWNKWDTLAPELRNYIPSVSLVGIGLFLIAIRNVEGINRHSLLAMGVLISVIVPLIAGLKFLMDEELGQSVFGAGIAVFSVIWFLFFSMKKGKDKKEQEEIKKSRFLILWMFLILLFYSILAFVSIETFQNILKYASQI